MIKMKGRVVTFTGKDEKELKLLAASLGKTPQETLELAIREHMVRVENTITTKKVKKNG
jgi:hypothetical protein